MNRIAAVLVPLFCVFAWALPNAVLAQEMERDLQFVPTATSATSMVNTRAARGSSSMSLPFFDDFASPTFEVEGGP